MSGFGQLDVNIDVKLDVNDITLTFWMSMILLCVLFGNASADKINRRNELANLIRKRSNFKSTHAAYQ